MRIVLAGRPGAGKSSLFDLVGSYSGGSAPQGAAAGSRGSAAPAPRPAPRSESKGGLRMAHVEVPDPRLWELSAAFHPRKTTPARIQFDDLEQKAAPTYPALSSERRDMLAQSELILLILDLFSVDPDDWPDAVRVQWALASEEFVLCDLAVVETRLERVRKLVRIGQKPAFPSEVEVLERLREALEGGRPVAQVDLNEEEKRHLRGYSFLSDRPMLPAFNIGEEHLVGAGERLAPLAAPLSSSWVYFSAEVEAQIQQLPPEDQSTFLEAFGLTEPAVAQVIRAAYDLAGLHCFFTVGEDEVRAWSVPKGALAPQAAGAIHSDLEKGFVRAEVLSFDDWRANGSYAAARDKGLFRLEGKEYRVHDGDIVNIRSGLAKGRG